MYCASVHTLCISCSIYIITYVVVSFFFFLRCFVCVPKMRMKMTLYEITRVVMLLDY